jgi:hypothetical protein
MPHNADTIEYDPTAPPSETDIGNTKVKISQENAVNRYCGTKLG